MAHMTASVTISRTCGFFFSKDRKNTTKDSKINPTLIR